MKNENIELLQKIAKELLDKGVDFYFQDKRWMDEGDDIDINVGEDSLDAFDSILKKHGFVFKKSLHPKYRMYRKFSNGELLKVHGQVGNYEGLPDDLLAPEKVFDSESYYLPKEEQIFFFMYRMAIGEPLEKYEKYLKSYDMDELDEDHLYSLLDEVFRNPRKITSKISNKNFSDLSFKFKLLHNLSRIKMSALNQGVRFFRNLKDIFALSPHISLIGPDGSGKTTAIEDLRELLEKNDISYGLTSGRRFTFQVLPLNWMFEEAEEKYSDKIKKNSKHAQRYRSPLVKLATPFIYYLEYLLRELMIIRPLCKEHDVVLSDRSFLDLIVSPNAHTATAKVLYELLPKPDVTVYLYNSLDVLEERRPEHPPHDLERQLEFYNSLNDFYDYKFRTDSRGEISEKLLSTVLSQVSC